MPIILLSQSAFSMFAEIAWKLRHGMVIAPPEEPRGNDIMCWWHSYSCLVASGLIREASFGSGPTFIELTPEGERQAEIHFADRSPPPK